MKEIAGRSVKTIAAAVLLAAIRAGMQADFTPAIDGTALVPSWVGIPLSFTIE